MRELTLGDAFWRDLLAALREPEGRGLARMRGAWPGYVDLVEELADAARGERCLIGGRPTTTGKNPRLLLLLTAAALAREGLETLYLDLSSELRWLEMLLDEDLKEGLVDHLQYDAPLEQCVCPSGLEGLGVLTGGAYFLAGSPLEDAPAFRAALERLSERWDAVVVAFPYPFDAAESAGVAALCEAWIAVEEADVEASLTGSERAVVRLVGDPQAAWDLARLSKSYLGSLPALLDGSIATAGATATGAGREPEVLEEPGEPATGDVFAGRAWGLPPQADDDEEVAFLRAFEAGPSPTARSRGAAGEEPEPDDGFEPGRPDPREAEGAPWPEPAHGLPRDEDEGPPPGVAAADGRRGRWPLVAVVAGAILVVATAVGFLMDGSLFADADEEADWGVEWGAEEGSAGDAGTVVALDAESDSATGASDAGAGDAEAPAFAGEAAPWSLHVGSYQSPESGMRVVRRLEESGRTAFLSPVDLAERGRWYRVYAGAFGDSTAAEADLAAILAADLVEEGATRRTPWAFRVSVHEGRAEAESALERLGVAGYVLGEAPAVVWAGAYRSEDEATVLATELEADAVAAALTRRERPRADEP